MLNRVSVLDAEDVASGASAEAEGSVVNRDEVIPARSNFAGEWIPARDRAPLDGVDRDNRGAAAE